MRIYYIGAHSSGKSTLARFTAKEYSLPFISEIARTVLAEKEIPLDLLRIDLDTTNNYQLEIFNRQIKEELKYSEFVSDRSFDNLAYMAQHGTCLHSVIYSNQLNNYIESLKKPDVRIFFIRPSKNTLKNDGIRESVNWDQIVAIDSMIKFMLEMFNLNYIQISTDSMQERIKIIKSSIDYSFSCKE